MKDRLKKVRNESPYGKSQNSFADFLGIPPSNLASYETGRRTPTDAVIQLICQKCSVNEDWLRTGNGEMFIPETKDEQITNMLADVLKSEDSDFKKRLIVALSKLDEPGWNALEKFIDSIAIQKEE